METTLIWCMIRLKLAQNNAFPTFLNSQSNSYFLVISRDVNIFTILSILDRIKNALCNIYVYINGVKLLCKKSFLGGKFWLTSRIFLVLVLLSASVERFFVSGMRDFSGQRENFLSENHKTRTNNLFHRNAGSVVVIFSLRGGVQHIQKSGA